LTCNFSKWCLSLLSYVFWYLYCWEKSFPMEKTHTGLSSVGSAFFHKFFYITTVSGSESVPESELFFGFWFDQNLRIRIHNTGMFNVSNIKFCVFCYPYCDQKNFLTHDPQSRDDLRGGDRWTFKKLFTSFNENKQTSSWFFLQQKSPQSTHNCNVQLLICYR
jgi:hypothetical protein